MRHNRNLSVSLNLRTVRSPALDGLRGLAILLVLLPHFGINHYLSKIGLKLEGNIGVHLFFVLSGFLITTLLLDERLENGHINLKRFYWHRILRIMPIAYIYLVTLIMLNILFGLRIPLNDFFQSFTFFKNLPLPSSPYTAHFWSLAVEVQFYLLFPALLTLNPARYFWLVLSIVVIVPSVAVIGYYHILCYDKHSLTALFIKLCEYTFWKGPTMILVGSFFAILLFRYRINVKRLGGSKFLSFSMLLCCLVICSPRFLYYPKYIAEYLSAIIFGLIILMSIGGDNFLSRVLHSRILIRIGLLSYSFYIWQQLFVGNHAWQPWLRYLSSYPIWMLMVLKFICVFLVAAVSYKLERVLLRFREI